MAVLASWWVVGVDAADADVMSCFVTMLRLKSIRSI